MECAEREDLELAELDLDVAEMLVEMLLDELGSES